MTRPSRALIDLGSLRHNYALLRKLHGGRALAVLKADGYGHGAVRCAQALQSEADGYAVAFGEEALALRDAGIEGPVLVLEGAFDSSEMHALCERNLWLVVHHEAQLRMLETSQLRARAVNVWLKIDSGMRRVGFPPSRAREAYERLRACSSVRGVTLMTHFARADETGCPTTQHQTEVFEAATSGIEAERSLCNSAGMLAWPAARGDWGRCGIGLYGADPLGGDASIHQLQPVMSLDSAVFSVRELAPGDELGYGGGFVADRPMRIGIVAVGYADGYPRSAPTGTPVAIDGQAARLVGRVSMDMLTVDLTDLPNSGCGSRVELWGKTVPVDMVARKAGSIAYELLCNVKRVPRFFSEAAQP